MNREAYRFLGNFNAAVDWAAVTLYCDPCRVSWIGCWDNAVCPVCGNSDSWGNLMKDLGSYKTKHRTAKEGRRMKLDSTCCEAMAFALKHAIIRANNGAHFGHDVMPPVLTCRIVSCPWCGSPLAMGSDIPPPEQAPQSCNRCGERVRVYSYKASGETVCGICLDDILNGK